MLVEPEAGGHHFVPYLLFFLRALIARGTRVQLMTTRGAQSHPAYSIVKRECSFEDVLVDAVAPASGPGTVPLLIRQFALWSVLRKAFTTIPNEQRPDHVVLMSLDSVDRACAVRGSPFGSVHYSGLLVHMKLHFSALGIGPSGRLRLLQTWLFNRLLRQPTLFRIATIDECLPAYWTSTYPKTPAKLQFVPDPGAVKPMPREEACNALKLDCDRQIVLVYGGLTMRKGIAQLLLAAQALPSVLVVLAGVMDAEVAALVAQPMAQALAEAGQLRVLAGYIDVVQEAQLFGAANVAWLGYAKDFNGQSAVMAQAASAGRMVLAREGGLIGLMTQRHGLGLCVNPDDSAAVAAALLKLQCDQALQSTMAKNAAEFAPSRSESAFAVAFVRCVPSDLCRLEGQAENR